MTIGELNTFQFFSSPVSYYLYEKCVLNVLKQLFFKRSIYFKWGFRVLSQLSQSNGLSQFIILRLYVMCIHYITFSSLLGGSIAQRLDDSVIAWINYFLLRIILNDTCIVDYVYITPMIGGLIYKVVRSSFLRRTDPLITPQITSIYCVMIGSLVRYDECITSCIDHV